MALKSINITVGDEELINFESSDSADSVSCQVNSLDNCEIFKIPVEFVDGTTDQVDVTLTEAQTTEIGENKVILQVAWVRSGVTENTRIYLKGRL